jgi:hypothetical protein
MVAIDITSSVLYKTPVLDLIICAKCGISPGKSNVCPGEIGV